MPMLRNPAGHRLFCHRLELIIEAGASVEITDEDADALEAGTVFVVDREPTAEPVRETVKRGAKRVEVTKAPERETREA